LYKQISFRKWKKREPLDEVIPFEKPSLLRRAVELLVSSGKKMADEIVSDLRIAASLVAAFCSLPIEFFRPRAGPEFKPILK
jgi:hypothetical protein